MSTSTEVRKEAVRFVQFKESYWTGREVILHFWKDATKEDIVVFTVKGKAKNWTVSDCGGYLMGGGVFNKVHGL